MCGIFGAVTDELAVEKTVSGLRELEYRGYDSAGIALNANGRLEVRKVADPERPLDGLVKRLLIKPFSANSGAIIGHNRWATHGAPNENNAHPHRCGRVACVHNGTIKNHAVLRQLLESEGYGFNSETDTEVICQLINRNLQLQMKPLLATQVALQNVEGSYGLAIIFEGHEKLLVVAQRESPIVIGFGDTGIFVASDVVALHADASQVLYLKDGDVATITRHDVNIYDINGGLVVRPIEPMPLGVERSSKGAFEHFTLKEIHEQTLTIEATLAQFIDPVTHRVNMPELAIDLKNLTALTLVASGTSYHAAIHGKYLFEELARIHVDCDTASEYGYRNTPTIPGQAVIFLSQSGTSADVRKAQEFVKKNGCPNLAIVNVIQSPLARDADGVIQTIVGPEIGVASTKSFTAQLGVLLCLAVSAGRKRGVLSVDKEIELVEAIVTLPLHIRDVLAKHDWFASIAEDLAHATSIFYLGRGINYPASLEASLKMKELSYIHAEGYPGGDLKHGPFALIGEKVPVVIFAPRDAHFADMSSNLREVQSREGKIILFSDEQGCKELEAYVWKSVVLPSIHPILNPFVYAVAGQLLAYYTAKVRKNPIDRPRNLAKSVTVE